MKTQEFIIRTKILSVLKKKIIIISLASALCGQIM